MMNICLNAVLLGFVWASTVPEVLVEAQCQIEPEADVNCIANYSNCSYSTKPCCREEYLRDGSDIYEEFICFRFGEGICEPLSDISNPVNYAQLVKGMNSTNFFERLRLFEQNFEVEISDPEFDYSPYVVMGTCGAMVIFCYAFTIFLSCYFHLFRTSQSAGEKANTVATKLIA